MNHRDGGGNVQNERLTVAVRVRPPSMSMDSGAGGVVTGNGHRAVSVINLQTLVLTEPPPADKIADLEHHFRTGSIFQSPPRPNVIRAPAANNNNTKQQRYEFDRVYDEASSQEEVYKNTAAPLIRSVLEGFYATIFAYGATSSGKTYTMVGTPSQPGIMARAVDDIFHLCSHHKQQTEVYLSYLEVYNEQIRDLLRPVPGISLELREDKDQVHVAGLSEIKTTSTMEVLELLQKGNRARTMEATAANVTSSRSHAVLLVTVRQTPLGSNQTVEGKLYLIDLAGSERASNTKNSGVRLREGGHINRSLLALGNCITALSSGDDKYINYRDSKLTRLLKAALGGPSKTAMIAHISPGARMYEETRNTLLYAQRARAISNRVKKFIQIPPTLDGGSFNVIQELRNEVKRLQMKLEARESGVESDSPTTTPPPVLNQSKLSKISPPLQQPPHFTKSKPSTPTQPPISNPKMYENYRREHEQHELEPIKTEIMRLFDEEFKLRNDLLKLDGAMLQSALDCEILRLMVLDWENLKVARESEHEGNSSEDSDPGKTEINSVMIELKQVRQEQEKLLHLRTDVENELKRIRGQIVTVEEGATQYLPEVQRFILSLLCKLQQEQVSKMSVEIEAELKRRGALLLRCLRQKALGEAIIHRQRHFLNVAISGYPNQGRETLSSHGSDGASPFFPSLSTPQQPIRRERLFYTPPDNQRHQQRLPPISSAGRRDVSPSVPKTTKYTDYRRARHEENRQGRRQRWSSEEELIDQDRSRHSTEYSRHPVQHTPRRRRSDRSASQDRFLPSY